MAAPEDDLLDDFDTRLELAAIEGARTNTYTLTPLVEEAVAQAQADYDDATELLAATGFQGPNEGWDSPGRPEPE